MLSKNLSKRFGFCVPSFHCCIFFYCCYLFATLMVNKVLYLYKMSLGKWNEKFCRHISTMFISVVLNNFIKKNLLMTKSKGLKSIFVKGIIKIFIQNTVNGVLKPAMQCAFVSIAWFRESRLLENNTPHCSRENVCQSRGAVLCRFISLPCMRNCRKWKRIVNYICVSAGQSSYYHGIGRCSWFGWVYTNVAWEKPEVWGGGLKGVWIKTARGLERRRTAAIAASVLPTITVLYSRSTQPSIHPGYS